jgi:hemoglobin
VTTLYEAAGGAEAFLALARAHHARCLADPELNHPFTREGTHPEHVERLAAYWAEVMGGPPTYSTSMSDQSDLLRLHSGNGDLGDLARRFVTCFVQAADDADLPADPRLRASLRAYMEWAVSDVLAHETTADTVPAGLAMPRWTWEGPAAR